MSVVGREDMHQHHMADISLLVAVGGDGTALSASHFLRDDVPMLAVCMRVWVGGGWACLGV